MMKLRHSPASPFVRKAMVVAHELGLARRIEIVPTAVSSTAGNDALAADNPLMEVPSLTAEDGAVLYDSPSLENFWDTSGLARSVVRPMRTRGIRGVNTCAGRR